MQEASRNARILARRLPQASFPATECAWINAQEPGRGFLGEPPGGPADCQLVAQGLASGSRIEAEQADDARQESQYRGGVVEFPVGDGGLGDAEPVG